MNKETLVDSLEQTKKFVSHNSEAATADDVEEMQSLLSECIEAANNSDEEELRRISNRLDKIAPNGWDLTSSISKELEN